MERTAVETYAYMLSGFKPVYDAFSTVLIILRPRCCFMFKKRLGNSEVVLNLVKAGV